MSGLVATLPLPLPSPSPSSAPRSASEFFSDPYDSHPLWFKPSLFLSPGFDSESYISELRTFVPFDTLRSQLRSHLASLNRELVDLINRDYADFVNLSTKLVDIDAAVIRMRAPLLELREKITGFRGSVEAALFSLRNGLHQRSDAAASREVLELLLNTFHVVSKVEKLIKVLPTTPCHWQNEDAKSLVRSCMSDEIPTEQDGTTMRETQSMLLERIASEVNRLKFYMAHAQNLPFIENMEKSIQIASVLLDANLGHCFIDGLNNSDTSVLYNCLRAYAAIDNTNNAEEIFRTTIVAPFIHKIISHETSADATGISGDELENDYKQIKHFIAKDCKLLLEISSTDKSGLHVFNFLANSILKEVLLAIQKVKPGAFSPGRPTEFLKNYKASLDFLAYLEGYCPSRSAVTKFRAEAICIEFMKQWNVGVYFSLRFQEIAGGLDSALTSSSLVFIQDSDSDKPSSPNLMLRQSVTLLESLRSCWKEDVLVFSAADKFLRLTLQLLSRYCNWVSSVVNTRKSNASPSPGCEWALSATAEDFIYVIHDVHCLVSEVRGDYAGHISHHLSSCSSGVLDVVRKSMLHGGESLENVIPLVTKTIIEVIVDKSVEGLRQLRGITATFMMPNKPLPVRHSPYVIGLLRPLKDFLEGDKARHYLTHETKEELLLGTVTEISRRYYELAAELVSEARKRETVLQKHRQNAQKRAGAASSLSDQNVSETDKMCMQLFLDLQEYGRNISELGLNPADIPPYCSLWQCVAPADRQNTTSV
ncbi:PREDICTED: conserved oligomeric Golgi complex subunit 2-like [Camelina sativa]|uniref:Conserved oligomeric Golgi complex subunit 2 n=1 Tax=Camelina sativa TaxID=90675 RepID=A0ABM0W0K9_CAMSA|nr:PREDICTED: conserved oligomeric Golgi complex subunit 2-like [Camelina sativa]